MRTHCICSSYTTVYSWPMGILMLPDMPSWHQSLWSHSEAAAEIAAFLSTTLSFLWHVGCCFSAAWRPGLAHVRAQFAGNHESFNIWWPARWIDASPPAAGEPVSMHLPDAAHQALLVPISDVCPCLLMQAYATCALAELLLHQNTAMLADPF